MKSARTMALLLAIALVAGCNQGCHQSGGATAGSVGSSAAAQARAAGDTATPGVFSSNEPREAQPRLPTLNLWLGAAELTTELATDDKARMTGMMFRKSMAENDAMLFVFPLPHRTSFWMKNTGLPLSAAYIDPDGIILEIHDLQPHNTNAVVAGSDQIQYVLETSQGWFLRHNVNTGALVRTERGSLQERFFPRK